MALGKSTHTDHYRRFRAMLVAERRAHGLTQVQVAERLGKPQSFVTKYELGERRLDVVEFVFVADAIGFDPATVLALLREGLSRTEIDNSREAPIDRRDD